MAASEQIEVELKFDVEAGTEPPISGRCPASSAPASRRPSRSTPPTSTPRTWIWRATRSPCAAAPADTTQAGISSVADTAGARRELRVGFDEAPTMTHHRQR